MANNNGNGGNRRRRVNKRGGGDPAQAALDRAERSASQAEELLSGGEEPELGGREHLDAIVRTIARRVSATQTRLTGGNTLETMARLKQDSLLQAPLVQEGMNQQRIDVKDGGKTLKDALDEVDTAMINELFATEKGRLDDYQTFAQIADLITQASEAVQTYCDNIVSPDDFTKRDITVYYDGEDPDQEGLTAVRARCQELIEKYNIDDKGEEAIVKSLVKGDYFVAVLNLRQELEGVLNENGAPTPLQTTLIEAKHVPEPTDSDMKALVEMVKAEAKEGEVVDDGNLRQHLAEYFNELIVVREDASDIAAKSAMSMAFAQDLPARRRGGKQADAKKGVNLAGTKIRGSVVKMIPPENVVKLYQEDTLFGYYYVELSGPDIADFARRGTMDQTALVRAIDQNLSVRSMGSNTLIQHKGKDALIARIITKTLAAKLGSSKYLKDHEELASDAYAILSRARREQRRATFTYVAPDQMVHFTPNGSTTYGESVLSRVKFLSKLYLGAMTNAFMRNSIRRPERLVWYIDVGVDNDGNNAVQNFIRTIKQREVKFSNLKDITTTINQIGEFHDFYVPTYNGERPVEVETLNMGGASEVDSPFLEYLRKAIIGGMGVPAAFVGYSEEVAFARSLTMDNGRFLRRVVRHQKHYGRAMSRVLQILWRNEYMDLEELVGKKSATNKGGTDGEKDDDDGESEESKAKDELEALEVDVAKIVVRYPSPATLNMTNLSDAINQGQPVADFITETLASSEEEPVKAELKKRVIQDLMPQIHWEKYEKLLVDAKKDGERKKAAESTGGDGGDGTASGGDGLGGDAGGDTAFN
jgi:hypothetical protein